MTKTMDMLPPVTADATDTQPVTKGRRYWVQGAVAVAAQALGGCTTSVRWFERNDAPPDPNLPALYRVNGPAGYPGAGWLLGAIHAGRSDLLPLPAAVLDRFHAADSLAVELDVSQRQSELHAAFSARALIPGGQRVDGLVSEATVSWLRQRFSLSDARWHALSRLQPWALTRALHGTDRIAEPVPTTSVEQHLLALARKHNKPVVELERPAEQVAALAGGNLQWQAQLLEFRVNDRNFWDNNVHQLIRAWRHGDESRILAIKQHAFGSDALRAPLRIRMFANRDKLMASRLAGLLTQPRSIFATVGAFHLVGKGSLRDELWHLGIAVERVDYHHGRG